jgi:hypothetical protein
MNNLDHMLERNKDFAAGQSAAGTLMPSLPRAMPNVKAVIIGCADMRRFSMHKTGLEWGTGPLSTRQIGTSDTRSHASQVQLPSDFCYHYFWTRWACPSL